MAARDEVDRNRSPYPPMFSANCRPGMARESEGRRHLDYGEAQSFQDLPLCRFLRLIWDELDAEFPRDGFADTPTTAGHDRMLVLQSEVHGILSLVGVPRFCCSTAIVLSEGARRKACQMRLECIEHDFRPPAERNSGADHDRRTARG
jgi:hypothetical protein